MDTGNFEVYGTVHRTFRLISTFNFTGPYSTVRFFSDMSQPQKQYKYISYYQYEYDDPDIIVFDTMRAARADARRTLESILEEPEEKAEALEYFDQHGHSDIEKYSIFASKCEYQPVLSRKKTARR